MTYWEELWEHMTYLLLYDVDQSIHQRLEIAVLYLSEMEETADSVKAIHIS